MAQTVVAVSTCRKAGNSVYYYHRSVLWRDPRLPELSPHVVELTTASETIRDQYRGGWNMPFTYVTTCTFSITDGRGKASTGSWYPNTSVDSLAQGILL